MAAQIGENDKEIIYCIYKSKGEVHLRTGHESSQRE
jgi:hypothetical protein